MVLIIEISKIGNILATENQQARINGVIEVKKACICTKLKQIQLRTTKNTPSSSDAYFIKSKRNFVPNRKGEKPVWD